MKTKSIFIAVFIGMLLVFSGCSQETEIPTKPLEKNEFNLLEINLGTNEDLGKDGLISIKLQDNKRIYQMGRILWGIENNKFSFVSDPAKIVFKNQIESVILMYNRKNMKGASQIIEKNILPKIDNIISSNMQKNALKMILSVQKMLFDDPTISDDVTIIYKVSDDTAVGFFTALLKFLTAIFKKCPDGQNHAGKDGVIVGPVFDDEGNMTSCEAFYGHCTCFTP